MSRHPIARFGLDLTPEEQLAFDRWLRVNAVIACVFVAAFFAIALASTGGPGPNQASAKPQVTSAKSMSEVRSSPRELMTRIAPNALETQVVSDPL
jgi:hypothetical protein